MGGDRDVDGMDRWKQERVFRPEGGPSRISTKIETPWDPPRRRFLSSPRRDPRRTNDTVAEREGRDHARTRDDASLTRGRKRSTWPSEGERHRPSPVMRSILRASFDPIAFGMKRERFIPFLLVHDPVHRKRRGVGNGSESTSNPIPTDFHDGSVRIRSFAPFPPISRFIYL